MARPRKKQPKTHARGWHHGSVIPAGQKWRAFREPYTDSDGKRIRPSKTFATEWEASAWARGDPVTARLLLGQWLKRWLALRWPTIRPKTRQNYLGFVAACAPLATVPLDDLTVEDWQALVNDLLTRWSREHVAVWRAAISGAMRAAVPDLLPHNPLARVRLPRANEAPPRAWRRDEATRLLMTARGGVHEAWLYVALGTGARLGELRALQWADIDLVRLTITISKSADNISSVIGPTKTGRTRVVDLPAEAVPLLVALRARQPVGQRIVFGRADNRPYQSNTFREWLRRQCVQANVTLLPVHALRHTCASLALDRGVPVQDVAHALGHTVQTCQRIYSHFIGQGQRRVASALGDVLQTGVSGGDEGQMLAELLGK